MNAHISLSVNDRVYNPNSRIEVENPLLVKRVINCQYIELEDGSIRNIKDIEILQNKIYN